MDIINNTRLIVAPLAGRIGFPKHSLTIVVKGTFNLASGKKAMPAKDQFFPTGDEFYPDDDEGDGSRFYESDFAYFKPRADLLLSGKCYPPGGSIQACKVTFGVGSRSKTLGIFGDRFWNPVTKTITDPMPFPHMELRYENSFGGKEFKQNPIGKGFAKVKNGDGQTKWPLPNIEDLNHLINSPQSRPKPAGFGPISSLWPQRSAKLGTYKGSWLKERWPWYPMDFDWGYFNAAPADMQLEGYLRGDETLYFENLHPTISSYHSWLPGIRPRLFVHRAEFPGQSGTVFFEPKLNLDTLWVDMETEKLVLVWRAVIEVSSEDYEEISNVFIVAENKAQVRETKEFYYDLFIKKIEREESIEAEEADAPEEVFPEIEDIDVGKEIENAEAEVRSALIAGGIDPDWEIPEPTEADRQEEARLLKEMGFEQEVPEALLTRELVMQRVGKKEGFSGNDLSGLDLSGLDMRGTDFSDAVLDNVNLKESILASCSFKNANLSKADLSSADLKGSDLSGGDFTESIFYGADLSGVELQDAVFDQADLRHAQLNDSNAENADFCEADLTGASFSNSRCRAADFSKSNLSGASFINAVLVEASVEDASGIGVNMKGADLSGLHASGKTNFSRGNFQKVTAPYSIWENVILDEADFSMSNMEGANFASASLKSAVFIGADLKYARLSKARLFQAKCMTMNLFEASLEKADLTQADFRLSNIYGAEFLEAVTDGALFEGANLKMTKLAKNN